MKKLKKINLEKRLEMLDKLSSEESNKLTGGYDWYGPGTNVGGATVSPTVSIPGGTVGGSVTWSF